MNDDIDIKPAGQHCRGTDDPLALMPQLGPGVEKDQEEEDNRESLRSDSVYSQRGRPSDLMVSIESNKVLSQQLDENQVLLQQQELRQGELEATVRQLTQSVEHLKADAQLLRELAQASDSDKDRAVAVLTADRMQLREALQNHPGEESNCHARLSVVHGVSN